MPASALRMMSSQGLYGSFASSDPCYKISPGVYRLLHTPPNKLLSEQADMPWCKLCQVSLLGGSSNSRHASSHSKQCVNKYGVNFDKA